MTGYTNDIEAADALREKFQLLRKEIGNTIIGQQNVVDAVLNAVFANGHVLLVGVPGLAKTLLVRTIAEVLDLNFNRIQFTPDLMPSDITGSEILNEKREFQFVRGPLFANIVLADEINRTPPKTQASLLEAMQERNVTAGGEEHKLPSPFFVLATQNPIEQEGTYPLPEAQLDRFMFHILVQYPSFQEEVDIVRSTTGTTTVTLPKTMNAEEILYFQQLVRRVPVPDNVLEYAVRLVQSTRPDQEQNALAKQYLSWGAGPRASQNLVLAAKCYALLHGKFSPDIEDIKAIALPVLRHRIIRNYKAEAEGISLDELIGRML